MTMDAYKKLQRLYVPCGPIHAGEEIALSEDQHHYLRNVMRIEAGQQVRVFNGTDGEWLAAVKEISKKNAIISFVQQLRKQNTGRDILILSSPIKKENFDFMVQKACELGAATFQPLLMDHTSMHKINEARLQGIADEAAEQSERLTVMTVATIAQMKNYLNSWDKGRKLIFCIERRDAPFMVNRLAQEPVDTPLALLIGPEGGFSAAEIEWLLAQDFVIPVSLGPTVLRAETAMIAALLCVQAAEELRK